MDGHVSVLGLLLLLPICAAGGLVQGSIGFGFSLVAVPVLALIEPRSVPATLLLLAFPMAGYLALRERRHIDVAGVAWIIGGRLLGTLVGVWILLAIEPEGLSVLIGAFVMLAVLVSSIGLDVAPTRASTFGAGILSGTMGTAAAIGGPALALIYQRRPGPELRSTLNISFVIGLVISLVALAAAGKVVWWQVVLAVELVPGMALGLWASRRVAGVLDRGWLRPAVLAFAAVAGLVLVARGLTGA